MNYYLIYSSTLAILCFAFALYVFRKGHPFSILALVIFNFGLIALDVVLFILHDYIEFHVTSHSSLILPFGLLVFFRNFHTNILSRQDKILLGVACSEYVLIACIYMIHLCGAEAYFTQMPIFETIQKFGRATKSSFNPAIDFAMAKDFLLFFVQLAIFPFVFYQILRELKKAKDRHLDFFTSDSFEFYTWNYRFITLIIFCYFPISIIIFHDFLIEFIPILRTTAKVLAGLLGLGLGTLAYFSPAYLKKEKDFPKMVAHFQKQNTTFQEEKEENSGQYDKYIPQLVQLFETQQVYRDPSLTLTSLAHQMNISGRHLSRIIKQSFNKKFSDFINGYRIEEVKRNLMDPKYDHYNILSIGLEAGFNSKSSFYTAFKKETGHSPAQFKKNNSIN